MNFIRPLIFVAASLGSMASASVVNIDFNRLLGSGVPTNTYSGLGAAADAPGNTTWNGIYRESSGSGVSGTSLLNSAGLVTSVSINIPAQIGHGNSVGDQEIGGGTLRDLMGDGISIDSNFAGSLVSRSGTIAGLAAGGFYEIFFYSQGNDNNGNNTDDGQNGLFAITSTLGGLVIGTAKQTGYDGVSGGNGVLTENVEYVKFSATANASGEIFFKWENVVPGEIVVPGVNNVTTDNVPNNLNNGSRYSFLNGIQIVQVVPEPSSALLALLGALGLMARRRR